MSTLLAIRAAGLPQPAAGVMFSPWVDATLTGGSMDTLAEVNPLFDRDRMKVYADLWLGDHDPLDPLASPVFADLSGLPPLLIQVGAHEVLLDDAVRLAARAGQDDVDVTLEVTAGVPHVFQNFIVTLAEAAAALDRAGQFLLSRLAVPADAVT